MERVLDQLAKGSMHGDVHISAMLRHTSLWQLRADLLHQVIRVVYREIDNDGGRGRKQQTGGFGGRQGLALQRRGYCRGWQQRSGFFVQTKYNILGSAQQRSGDIVPLVFLVVQDLFDNAGFALAGDQHTTSSAVGGQCVKTDRQRSSR